MVIQLNHQCIAHVTSTDPPLSMKLPSLSLLKYFECGESVRIVSGTHSGESGLIAAITDKHAVVSMEGTKAELKILLSNLKSKKEESCCRNDDYVQKSVLQIRYQAGELILFDNYQSIGLVLHVLPDFLRVLNSKNQVQNVK